MMNLNSRNNNIDGVLFQKIKNVKLLLIILTFFAFTNILKAEVIGPLHGIALGGSTKYKNGFKHYEYVNPNAPKGGTLNLGTMGSYDSLNPFIIQGQSAAGLGLVYETLFANPSDESSTAYGLIAESLKYNNDFSWASFQLNPKAKWHDGKTITPEDVIFSFDTITAVNPRIKAYYENVTEVKKTGDFEVTFYFDTKNNRELPLIVSELNILPKHYWEGVDKDNNNRDFSKTSLEPPLGSGPYKVSSVDAGKNITYERVKNYWGKDVNVNVGRYNYDFVKYDYYLNLVAILEAFKAGKVDYRRENSAKRWATEYEFPAVKEKKVITKEISFKGSQPMQAFVFNTRREKFKDPKVRQAFNYAYDFEWQNEKIYYNQYKRTSSYFEKTDFAGKGLPVGRELEILNEYKNKIPKEVFIKEYKNPVFDSKKAARTNLRTAIKLLNDAGYALKDGIMTNKESNEKLEVEFLIVQSNMDRIINPYIQALKKIGVVGSIRLIDTSQYINRFTEFDFDIVITGWRQSEFPGNEQRYYWGSKSADQSGSSNYAGIKNEAIDGIIEKIIFAKDRDELIAAGRALDRVLLWNHYVVPMFYAPNERVAWWIKLKHPPKYPEYDLDLYSWWIEK